MAGNSQDSGKMIAGINVTPLVDITLVLLIIFMVTAKLVVAPQSAVKLDLPTSATGDQVVSVFSVLLPKDGSVHVNGQSVANDEALVALARAEHQTHPDLRAVIQADGDLRHAQVVHVMDLLSQASISQIAIAIVQDKGAIVPKP
jgi:biopolymer transport protein ExbD